VSRASPPPLPRGGLTTTPASGEADADSLSSMAALDGGDVDLGAAPRLGREFRSGALLASLGLVVSFAALGLNSIFVARIEGTDGAGLIALSTQFIFIAIFLAGAGLRTSVAYRVGAGLWSPRSAVHGALVACLALGIIGAALGMGAYALLRHSAMSDFNVAMAASLMAALPFALAWWILPAIPLARELFEQYALLTAAAPVCVLLLSPALALAAGKTGAVIGFAGGWVLGGILVAAWAARYARRPEAARGPSTRLRDAGGFGVRAWVNDLFQLINLRPDLFILSAYFGAGDTGVWAVTVSITSLVWIVSQPLASVVLPRAATLAATDPGLTPELAPSSHISAVRHSVLVSLVATVLTVPVLAVAPLVWGPGFGRIFDLGLILLPGVLLLGVGRVMVAAFTGRGAANQALIVGIVSFPLTFIAFLLVIPDHGATGAAVVSCGSYVVASLTAAVLFFRSTHTSLDAVIPRASDLGDYMALVRRALRRGRRVAPSATGAS
jgi:O-antigen/teichoic acid export membrane protein